jgi:pimeloyl-ACP methyl ester carboxylesterase
VAPDVLGVSAAVAEGRTPSVPYVLADMADDAVAVLDDLGIDRAHVMGLSMGGMIVQQLAIAHPERLRSLTSVMSTTGDPDVGQAHREARALLFGPPATTREEAIARAVQGLHVWGSPEHLDDERTASIAAEAYDRAFDPAGQARQLMGILASRAARRPSAASTSRPSSSTATVTGSSTSPAAGARPRRSPAPPSR